MTDSYERELMAALEHQLRSEGWRVAMNAVIGSFRPDLFATDRSGRSVLVEFRLRDSVDFASLAQMASFASSASGALETRVRPVLLTDQRPAEGVARAADELGVRVVSIDRDRLSDEVARDVAAALNLPTMSPKARAGFWSYVHADDSADGGRITRLAEAIKNEYGLLTGEVIEVFSDRDIAWGDEWRRRIDEALEGTAFFIPVITPRYFESEACRGELLTFSAYAKSLGVTELILPLLYVQVHDLDREDLEDEAVELIRRIQWFDWRRLRLEDENSTAYRQGVHQLAERLVEINAAVADRSPPELSPEAQDVVELEPPGLVEIMAAAEAAMPRLQEVIESFPLIFEEITDAMNESVIAVQESDAANKGFTGRLLVARNLARRLEGPAEQVLELGNRYSRELGEVDAGVLTLIRVTGEEEPLNDDDHESICGLFAAVRQFGEISAASAEQTREMLRILEETSGVSRELRAPVSKISDGLRQVAAGQAIIDEWVRRIDQSAIECDEL